MADSRSWAGPAGLPPEHVVRAALHVAALLDKGGSRVVDARETYWHRALGGSFSPPDLRLGEQLLIDTRLVEESDGSLFLLPDLNELLEGSAEDAVSAITARVLGMGIEASARWPPMESLQVATDLLPDPNRREEFLAALGRRYDETLRRLLGEIGEQLVLRALRDELIGLGYPQLARRVRHVSLETDQAGYDVSAPRISGDRRLIEVKTTSSLDELRVTVHLSRNEAETGLRFLSWALVLCRVADATSHTGEIVGWASATHLTDLLPTDVPNGKWESAAIELDVKDLIPGLPGAVG